MSTNYLINDPVPRNVSKFPIHQTYLTDDAERTGNGGYKFKAPEVWSSARSGKKSIAVRSIQWLPKSLNLSFGITIVKNGSSLVFKYSGIIPERTPIYDVFNSIIDKFDEWANKDNEHNLEINFEYFNNTHNNQLIIDIFTPNSTAQHQFRIHNKEDSSIPSSSFNELLNQPASYFPDTAFSLAYHNVWDRSTALNFHASFVSFDNYQYLGTVFDKWQTPIIYQDPNSSPLFNVWITVDLKTPFKLLYESFIFRFTFIISSESQYHA